MMQNTEILIFIALFSENKRKNSNKYSPPLPFSLSLNEKFNASKPNNYVA